mgnify:CR=1 FL=1
MAKFSSYILRDIMIVLVDPQWIDDNLSIWFDNNRIIMVVGIIIIIINDDDDGDDSENF